MMVLFNADIEAEIKKCKDAIKSIRKTKKECEHGIAINEFVLKAFEDALIHDNKGKA